MTCYVQCTSLGLPSKRYGWLAHLRRFIRIFMRLVLDVVSPNTSAPDYM